MPKLMVNQHCVLWSSSNTFNCGYMYINTMKNKNKNKKLKRLMFLLFIVIGRSKCKVI